MSRRSPYLLAATLVLAGLLGGHVVIETAFSDPNENPLLTLVMGRDWPVLSHLLAALPALAALLGLLLSRRTVAVPIPRIGIPLALLGGLAWSSVLVADNKAAAVLGAVEWSAYGLIFFAVVAGGGRSTSRLLLGAIAIGGTAAAALAIRQYGEMKAFDPGFRVQGPWNNPNAIGAYLGIALIAALALVPTSERLGKMASLLGAVLIALALTLTQSRGAILTTGLGVVVWLVVLGLARSKTLLPALLTTFAAVALAALMTVAATRRPAEVQGGGAFGRVTNVQEASVQSVGFRQLLWKSAAALTRENPFGAGLNSFGPRSSEPGLVTQTQLAHSTPLQLAAEISPIGGTLFVLFFAIVGWVGFRGMRSLDENRKATLAGAAGALAGALAHNLFDSDAYYFGLGLTLFALAGILLLAASDTSAPELVPSNWRLAGGAAVGLLIGVWIVLAQMDRTAAVSRGLALTGQGQQARAALEALGPLASLDGRLLSRRALVATSDEERLTALRDAATLAPSARNWRAVAAERLRQRNADGAKAAYEEALRLDPNNLPALTGLRTLLFSNGDTVGATQVALRTIDVEKSSYFTVRSQAEIVPTATAEARMYLAERSMYGPTRQDLLLPALAIFQSYATLTVPGVVRFDNGSGAGGDFGGETREKADAVLKNGRETIARLRADGYRDERRLAEAEAAFAAAEALLRRDSAAR